MSAAAEQSGPVNRREFLKTSTLAAAGSLSASAMFAAGSDKIRVGLIGCGARGVGAAMNCVLSGHGVEITALGDVFQSEAENALKRLRDHTQPKERSCSKPWRHSRQVKATPEACFQGFDAYHKVLAANVDRVILAGPPGFRPQPFQAAVAAGNHVFMEKPVAVDPVGVRQVIAAAELAAQKKLAIGAGTQRRHQASYEWLATPPRRPSRCRADPNGLARSFPGGEERDASAVSVRLDRKGPQGAKLKEAVVAEILAEIKERRAWRSWSRPATCLSATGRPQAICAGDEVSSVC